MINVLLILLCLFSSAKNKSHPTFTETVDKIEINTCHAEFTQKFRELKVPIIAPSYKQVVFYEWSVEYSRYHVMSWKMLETVKSLERNDLLEEKTIPGKKINYKWYDGLKPETECFINKVGDYYYLHLTHNKKKFIIRSKNIEYTNCLSEDDPERKNKKYFEEKYRRNILP